jgi:hypothetical protein
MYYVSSKEVAGKLKSCLSGVSGSPSKVGLT